MMMKKTIFTAISAIALLAGGTLAVATFGGTDATAQAQSAKSIVDSANSKGVIGETIAGYLAETGQGSLSSAERAAMNEINIGRKSIYTKKARAENLQVEVVAAVFGEKQIAKSASGEKVMDSSGVWRKK